jgi:hypothetical protein
MQSKVKVVTHKRGVLFAKKTRVVEQWMGVALKQFPFLF